MINNMRSLHAATFITLRWWRLSASVLGRKTDGWLSTSHSRLIHLHRGSLQVLSLSSCLLTAVSWVCVKPPTRLDIWGEFQQRAVRRVCDKKTLTVQTVLIRHWWAAASWCGIVSCTYKFKALLPVFPLGPLFFLLSASYRTDAVTSCIPARASALLRDSSS